MNKNQRTLLIIKPDIIKSKNIGKIVEILERNDMDIIYINIIKFDQNTAENFYYEHKDKEFFNELISFMISGPIIVIILSGIDIINRVRNIIGSTNFEKAMPNTIRKLFATSITKNAVHASDSLESFEKEIKIIINNIKSINYVKQLENKLN